MERSTKTVTNTACFYSRRWSVFWKLSSLHCVNEHFETSDRWTQTHRAFVMPLEGLDSTDRCS